MSASHSAATARGSRRRLVFGVVGTAFGLGMWAVLLRWSGYGVHHWISALRRVESSLALVALLGMALNAMLAAIKWRRVEASLSGSPPSLVLAFAATAVGGGVGQLVPTPISSAIVRGLGNRAARRSARHGIVASAWEQLFDLAAAALLAGPGIAAILHARPEWVAIGTVGAVIAGEIGSAVARRAPVRAVVRDTRLTEPSLCRFLWRVSLARMAVLMVVTAVIGRAFGLNIESWMILAAVPPVVLAAALSFIPAGVGINELTFVGLFGLAGIALPVATAFAVLNRALQICIALILALCGCALMGWKACAEWLGAPRGAALRAGNAGNDA